MASEPLTAEDLLVLRGRAYWGSNAGDMLRLLAEVERLQTREAALTEGLRNLLDDVDVRYADEGHLAQARALLKGEEP